MTKLFDPFVTASGRLNKLGACVVLAWCVLAVGAGFTDTWIDTIVLAVVAVAAVWLYDMFVDQPPSGQNLIAPLAGDQPDQTHPKGEGTPC